MWQEHSGPYREPETHSIGDHLDDLDRRIEKLEESGVADGNVKESTKLWTRILIAGVIGLLGMCGLGWSCNHEDAKAKIEMSKNCPTATIPAMTEKKQ